MLSNEIGGKKRQIIALVSVVSILAAFTAGLYFASGSVVVSSSGVVTPAVGQNTDLTLKGTNTAQSGAQATDVVDAYPDGWSDSTPALAQNGSYTPATPYES